MMAAFSSNKDMREAMDLPRNNFKHALAGQQMQIGLWSTLCSHIGAEIVADCGFDWVLLDTEHSPSDIPILVTQMQAMMRGTATPVVRPAWNDIVLIKRILDAGATSLLIPFVQDADEARRAVAATRYPPLGIRGVSGSNRAARYGRIKDYLHRANQEICVLVQIETASALEKLEAIAAVEGVDGVFVGPADLAASLGHTGDQLHPTVQAAIQDAGQRLKKVGKAAGILTPVEADAKRYITWGYTFVAVGSDTGLLIKAGDALARTFKG